MCLQIAGLALAIGLAVLLLVWLGTMAGCVHEPAINVPSHPGFGSDGLLNSGDFGPKLYNSVDGEEVDEAFLAEYRALLPTLGQYITHATAPADTVFPQLPNGHYFIPAQVWQDRDDLVFMSENPKLYPPKKP